MLADGLDPLPAYIAPYESVASNPAAGREVPAGDDLSAGAQLPQLDLRQRARACAATEGEPHLDIHPHDAAARGIAHGDMARIFNDRGTFVAQARA